MAYATVTDMVERFGETELIRLSASDGPLPSTVTQAPVLQALADATSIIDSYLRKRYAVPLGAPPLVVVRNACILARYDLATGGDREASKQMRQDRDDVMAWLNRIADGTVTLEGVAAIAGGSSARTSDRARFIGADDAGAW